jgi:hypothetical protein
MKNRPREIRRLLKLAALTAAKGLYPAPRYEVFSNGAKVYVDKKFDDDTFQSILVIDSHVW